jgi:hypothetical protein
MILYRTIITSIFAIGLAAAMQTTSARELPDSIQQFADAQQEQILIQGFQARRAISYKLKDDFAEQRVAFIKSQMRSIEQQGERALVAIKEDLDFRGTEGMVAVTLPKRMDAHDWPTVAASTR